MKIKRRITIVLICFMSVMFVLLCRLIQIQIIDTESFTDRKINLIEKCYATHTIHYSRRWTWAVYRS